jgi:hypothetical protein
VSPIPVSELPATISDALPMLDSASDAWTRSLAPAWRPKAVGSAGR